MVLLYKARWIFLLPALEIIKHKTGGIEKDEPILSFSNELFLISFWKNVPVSGLLMGG